ncbi:hypothetical protein BN2364_3284 [Alloalcanivorax xenomutans]|nr:hypothetical protein BN2364_3284 [Alloalcanivorax xenomutans]
MFSEQQRRHGENRDRAGSHKKIRQPKVPALPRAGKKGLFCIPQ